MDKPSAHSDQARKSQYINQIIAFKKYFLDLL